jgi:hypothetical protein
MHYLLAWEPVTAQEPALVPSGSYTALTKPSSTLKKRCRIGKKFPEVSWTGKGLALSTLGSSPWNPLRDPFGPQAENPRGED